MQKVLIITYYWPPAGGSGVQRWLKFAHFIRDHGWEPVIVTPQNPDVVLRDESLINEVSDDMEVVKIPIWEPYHLFRKSQSQAHPALMLEDKEKSLGKKLAIWVRANVFIPDPKIFWKKAVVKHLHPRLKSGEFDAMISTGPPHSMHLIALEIKNRYGLRWLADFRDPWTEWELWQVLGVSEWGMRIHRRLEKKVLKNADASITISPTFKRDFEKIAKKEIHLITNGYDHADFPSDFFERKPSDKFTIIYTGIIDSIRNPMPFLKAVEDFLTEDETRSRRCEILFIGQVNQNYVDYIAASDSLSAITTYTGYIPHKEVFNYYAKAHILLLILTLSKNSQGNIPGKIFEYGATGRTILGIGNPGGDSSEIIQKENAGKVFWPKEMEGIQSFIASQYERFLNGEMQHFTPAFKNYERRQLAAEVVRLLGK
ncbi:MAG: glycosyltransferase family 4 protein [Cryomorphaceae bacterium]|nr:glycosyltransferase family 4 protein [Cryomorphaceae bacterium]